MENKPDDQTFDFTTDTPSGDDVSSLQLGSSYDSRPQEDAARRIIAYLLIGLLWVITGGIIILIAFGSIELSDVKEFGVILGPVVALVSAATGFYYGTKSNSNGA